jgi:hypothetical protein
LASATAAWSIAIICPNWLANRRVRQVAPELLAELGEPLEPLVGIYFAATHDQLEAARVLAKLLGIVEEYGDARVRPLLEAALERQRTESAALNAAAPVVIVVPDALAGFTIEAGKAADYDHLPLAAGARHE